MNKERRISAGGITFKDDAVLLVRYPDGNGGSYLVAPGGAVEDGENIVQAVIRETKEETDVRVRPRRVLVIEDLAGPRVRMVKIWMICDVQGGEIRPTEGAEKEGIIEAAWFTKSQLKHEVVYPRFLIQRDWNRLRSEKWRVECLPSREADI